MFSCIILRIDVALAEKQRQLGRQRFPTLPNTHVKLQLHCAHQTTEILEPECVAS